MKMKLIRSIGIILAAAVLAGCSASVETPLVAETLQPDMIIAEGRLFPVISLEQSFAIPGQIEEVLVAENDTVEFGQVLARLVASPEARLALSRAIQEQLAARLALETLEANAALTLAQAELTAIDAQNALETAQSRYDNNRTEQNLAKLEATQAELRLSEDRLGMLRDNSGIDSDLQAAAEARIASADAALESALAAVEARELKASLAGTVVDINLKPGQRVSAFTPLMSVADLSQWIIETDNLTETEVVSVQVGQKVSVVFDALPELTLQGEVSRIDQRFEEKRGDITYTTTIILLESDPLLRWGMTASIKFVP